MSKEEEKMDRFSITMPKDISRKLRELSQKERRPISAQLTLIVEKYLEQLQQK